VATAVAFASVMTLGLTASARTHTVVQRAATALVVTRDRGWCC
jgi:hypothetical protein